MMNLDQQNKVSPIPYIYRGSYTMKKH